MRWDGASEDYIHNRLGKDATLEILRRNGESTSYYFLSHGVLTLKINWGKEH